MSEDSLQVPGHIAQTLRAVVSVQTHIPAHASSAGLLGTERSGHGTVIRDDGLIATIGYLIHEAETVWIESEDGKTLPAYVIAYDYESGWGLVKPTLPLSLQPMPLGAARELRIGDPVMVASHEQLIESEVVAKHEFAGRWEYVIDEAVYTSPPHPNWGGAALMDMNGRLCGVGSLLLQSGQGEKQADLLNMFVPVELLSPFIDELCEHGRRNKPPRPWLGFLVEQAEDELIVVGIYRDCPADHGKLKPGDRILRVDGDPVVDLASLFRRIWSLGDAGVQVPITFSRGEEEYETVVDSVDRNSVLMRGAIN